MACGAAIWGHRECCLQGGVVMVTWLGTRDVGVLVLSVFPAFLSAADGKVALRQARCM